MTFQAWERRPSFEIKDGRRVYPVYAVGANGDRYNGGTIYVHDIEVAPDEVETNSARRRVLGTLTWVSVRGLVVEVLDTDVEWRLMGVARGMWDLARSEDIAPSLRHAPCTSRTEDGERFVRATDPEQACRGNCEPDCRGWASQIGMPGEEGALTSVRPPGLWARIRASIGL